MRIVRTTGVVLASATAIVLSAGAALAACDWKPERPVSYIVPWGAGGGTDANSRMLASMLEKHFDVPFNVVNRTGGNGVVGHSAIATGEPDGYTIGAATVEITTMHHAGLTELNHTDITPIALVDIVPSSVLVAKDSEFNSLNDLLTYAKANPGKLTGSGTAQGGIWHLALAGMLNSEGMDPAAIRWVPSNGAAAAMQELIAGGVDVATPALSEGKALVESGELKALAYMHDSNAWRALPDVPTTKDAARQRLDARRLHQHLRPRGPAGRNRLQPTRKPRSPRSTPRNGPTSRPHAVPTWSRWAARTSPT